MNVTENAEQAISTINKQTKVSIALTIVLVAGIIWIVDKIDSVKSQSKDLIQSLINEQRKELRQEFVTKAVFEANIATVNISLEQIKDTQQDMRQIHRESQASNRDTASEIAELRGSVSALQREIEILLKRNDGKSKGGDD